MGATTANPREPFLYTADSGIPDVRTDEETGEELGGDFITELAVQLVEGSVAIVMQIGSERMRYLTGYAIAVNAAGAQASIDLDEIYARAKVLGRQITTCTY